MRKGKQPKRKLGKKCIWMIFLKRGTPIGQEAYNKFAQSHQSSEKCKLKLKQWTPTDWYKCLSLTISRAEKDVKQWKCPICVRVD